MAAAASELLPMPAGKPRTGTPLELAVNLVHSPGMRVHLHIDLRARSLLVFLTSSATDAGSGTAAPMGSLVYAMPDRYNPSQPMSTVLYALPSSVDFATRVAKALVRRVGKPCFVGSSINLAASAGGGGPDEEMEAFRAIIAVVAGESEKA